MPGPGKKKNFTNQEKNMFLELLKYKNIIENKDTDGSTISMKKTAWERLTHEFNGSAIVVELASADQLRRLWQNLKQRQRTNLAKERQHRMATGGGGPCPDAEVDPDIAEVTSALLVEIPSTIDSDSYVLNRSFTSTEPTEPLPLPPSPPPAVVKELITDNDQPEGEDPPLSYNEKKLRVQILKKEFIARERRASETHSIEIKILEEKYRMAKSQADLAEKELNKTST